MINSVLIKDNTNSTLRYLPEVDNFANGKEYKFEPGINIIVGENGCGKSTLLKLISDLYLCNALSTKLPSNALDWDYLFDTLLESDKSFHSGVEVKGDYRYSICKYIPAKTMKKQEIDSSINTLALHINGNKASTGEATMLSLQGFFDYIFSDRFNVAFPIKSIIQLRDSSSQFWSKRFQSYIDYLKSNLVETNPPRLTLLLDEPDRNLDIKNLTQIYKLLKSQRDDTQLICVLHNQMLIHKLHKLKYINWIEMTPDYLKSIDTFLGK